LLRNEYNAKSRARFSHADGGGRQGLSESFVRSVAGSRQPVISTGIVEWF